MEKAATSTESDREMELLEEELSEEELLKIYRAMNPWRLAEPPGLYPKPPYSPFVIYPPGYTAIDFFDFLLAAWKTWLRGRYIYSIRSYLCIY